VLLGIAAQPGAAQAASLPTPVPAAAPAVQPGLPPPQVPRPSAKFNRWIVVAAVLVLVVGVVALKPWRFIAAQWLPPLV
jgi:hypothetical protein